MKNIPYIKGENKKGDDTMIIMDIKVDNLYSFRNFHMNMSYENKIDDSNVPNECLQDRHNFLYKKLNILMGANATGKTSLGKLMRSFLNYFLDGEYHRFTHVIDNYRENASLSVDFVTELNRLYRFQMKIAPCCDYQYTSDKVEVQIYYTEIEENDSYKICAEKLDRDILNGVCKRVTYEQIRTNGWYFSYPYDSEQGKIYASIEDNKKYIMILERILKTLDPSIQKVTKSVESENMYIIKFTHRDVIIKDGTIANADVLSSGTKAGLDISYIIASIICGKHDLYYCDELFSYVNSDIEKTCLSILIDRLTDRKQLFFTTHNIDILDMQLPDHSFSFLRKDIKNHDMPIKCVTVSDYLRKDMSLKNAVENDLFCTAPDIDALYEIADM